MSLKVNVRKAFSNPAELLKLRLASQNARHVFAKAGVECLRSDGFKAETVDLLTLKTGRGFYSWLVAMGFYAISPALEQALSKGGPIGDALASELQKVHDADSLFTGFDAISQHKVLDLTLSVYPGLESLSRMRELFPEQYERYLEVKALLGQNMMTVSGQPSPIVLLEDHPGWASEKPDIRNIRGDMANAVREQIEEARNIEKLIDQTYGLGTMAKIKYVIVVGIGANDMYLKALPRLVNADPASKRKLLSIFEPSQLDELPADVTLENALFIPISRSGGTQETIKSMYFGKIENKIKYMVGYANKGLLKEYIEREKGIVLSIQGHIGGRYMWAKGKIVLVPLALTASGSALEEYTSAMIEFDNKFWPVGEDMTILGLAGHMYHYIGAYNISGIFACSNQPVLEASLRELFQLHNEAVGKVINGTIAFGPGMEMLPFAHAGADGILGSAISAQHYGAFIFDTSFNYNPQRNVQLTLGELLAKEAAHEGLTKQMLKMACVFPNQAKFTYAGAPNFMLTMDGVSYRNLATLTALYQNLMYPYLIMNETNPDSNPNVDMVRKTTDKLITALIEGIVRNKTGKTPIQIISEETPNIMKPTKS